jgi:protein-disulfide isomerase
MVSGRSAKRDRARRDLVADRRGPSLAIVVAVVAVLLFAGAVGFGVYRAQQGSDEVVVPAGGSPTGITVGQAAAPATIDIYLDFQCPICKTYEEQTGATIDELIATGQANVVYHPVAYLNRFSSTQYSTRSSQASACAADAGVFPAYLKLLFAEQPPENSAGLPDEQLVALGRQVGAGDAFASCVEDERYAGWTRSVTDAASRAGVNGTPTVLVNGTVIENTPGALRAAVQGG